MIVLNEKLIMTYIDTGVIYPQIKEYPVNYLWLSVGGRMAAEGIKTIYKYGVAFSGKMVEVTVG